MQYQQFKVKLQRFIDHRAGDCLSIMLSLFAPKKQPLKNAVPASILLVKLWAVGESILTLPLLEQLKQHYPETKIDVLTRERNKDVYTGLPFITTVHTLEEGWKRVWSLRNKYDIAIDAEPYLNSSALLSFLVGKQTIGFTHGTRSRLYTHKIHYNDNQHVVLTYLDMARPLFNPVVPKNLVPLSTGFDDELVTARILKEEHVKHPIIGICTGAAESAKSRMWAKEKFVDTINYYTTKKHCHIILVGSPSERAYNEELVHSATLQNLVHNLAGKTTLKQLFTLIKKCDVFLSNDTGPMHIAAAQGVPTLGLFCPNTPVRFGPYGTKNKSLHKPILPHPCINVHRREVPDCTNHDHLSKISVEDVVKELDSLLEKKKKK